jgi:hypothetical protein
MYTGHSEDHKDCQQIFEPATWSITKLFSGENKPHYKKTCICKSSLPICSAACYVYTNPEGDDSPVLIGQETVSGAHCNTVVYSQSPTLLEINPIIQFMAKNITGTAK